VGLRFYASPLKKRYHNKARVMQGSNCTFEIKLLLSRFREEFQWSSVENCGGWLKRELQSLQNRERLFEDKKWPINCRRRIKIIRETWCARKIELLRTRESYRRVRWNRDETK